MGGIAVLHPQPYNLKDIPDNLLPTAMQSRRRRNPTVVTDSPAVAASKNLVIGQVKILKRGEALNESKTILKDVNDRKASNGTASTPSEVSGLPISCRTDLHVKKKKNRKRISNLSAKVEDVALSSTDRLGPDPELVTKQMKNITEFFAGPVFYDSPPPSSVPLPGFFTKKPNLV